MKPTLLSLSLCGLALAAGAQSGKPAGTPPANLSAFPAIAIQLAGFHDPPPLSAQSPFAHFEVVDERPDTARIGVHGNLPMHSHFFDRQLIFAKPARQEIAAWLNRHFTHPGAPDSMLVILRYLWLSDTDPYNPNPDQYSSFRPDNPAAGVRTHIRLKAEIYARSNDRYLPLLRIDTLEPTRNVIYNARTATYNGWEKDLAGMLRDLVENAALATRHKENSNHWISRDDIRRFNQSRFDIPIFDSTTLIRGVYTGFEEFRNNAPSIHDFEVRPDNGHLALYLRNGDGTSYYTHNVWGYCNGKQVFIMRDGLLHLLRKDGRSFYFYGVDIASNSNPPISAFNGYPEQHCLYIVDMDSGQFY
ncbi:MAG TPA: hypothetical protein VFE32_15005 [Puia sp.]|jgi:hypothetical protein|nr:hypothetical protein [Puia sp.]